MKTRAIVSAVLGGALLAGPCMAEIPAAQGRELLGKVSPAVVSVRTVTKTTMSMEGRQANNVDRESECTGCVVNADGLTAVSLSGIDPYSLYGEMMAAMGGEEDFKVQSEISDMKIRFNDGVEVPAEVAIRDKDLDLAFVRPKTRLAAPVPFIDLTSAGDAAILDPVLVVTRFGKQNRWETMAAVQQVQSVLSKPRRMFLLQDTGSQAQETLGSLAVAQDGKALGVLLLRRVPATGKDDPQILLVVLPAKDVVAVAKQVESGAAPSEAKPATKPAAKPAAPKPATKPAAKPSKPARG